MEVWLLALAGLFAGFVDSIVGGGGAISLPALLAAGLPPHAAVATNKVAGTGASSIATWQYARAGLLDMRLIRWGLPFALAGGFAGAAIVLRLPEDLVLALVVVVVAGLALYVLMRPRFGTIEAFRGHTDVAIVGVAGLALVAGTYDGILGPGTGNILLFGLVALTGYGFLPAAANGRALNLASNIGALVYFILVDAIDWQAGLILAAGTSVGAFFGARTGIRFGAAWIRPLFVAVALLLLARTLMGPALD